MERQQQYINAFSIIKMKLMGFDILPYIYNAFNNQFNPFHVVMLLQPPLVHKSIITNNWRTIGNYLILYICKDIYILYPVSLRLMQLCPQIPHEMLKMPHYKLHQKMPRKSSILPELGQPRCYQSESENAFIIVFRFCNSSLVYAEIIYN